jgi:hypothetical protein
MHKSIYLFPQALQIPSMTRDNTHTSASRETETSPPGADGGHRFRRAALCMPLLAAFCFNPAIADEELVSFSCALAIDAVLAKLDEQPQNLVIQQALSEINDRNGQFVCIPINANELQVRLQSTDMSNSDNRLVFSLDANTYNVRKTFYGR